MTQKQLFAWMLAAICYLTVLAIISFSLGALDEPYRYFEAFRASIPVFLAIPAAWLGFCFQRRVSCIGSLRVLWGNLVAAVQDAIQYTYKENQTRDDCASVLRGLDCVIDEFRSVFKNLDECPIPNRENVKKFVLRIGGAKNIEDMEGVLARREDFGKFQGIFPFESMRQIRSCIQRLGYDNENLERNRIARETIVALWETLRAELLREFDRATPQYPETPFHRSL